MKAIGIYIPSWLYRSDKTDRIFADELFQTIKMSGRYRPIRINIPMLSLRSSSAAKAFCKRHNLALVIQHDSPFYSDSKRYSANVNLLETEVPFINAHATHEIGHDKISTKRLLRKLNIPVLDDVLVTSKDELFTHLEEDTWHVVKPADKGAGSGVKLIKKTKEVLYQYRNGAWLPIQAISRKRKDGSSAVTLKRGFSLLSSYTYAPMLVEPYFNDDPEGFSSLRCTIVGNEIVEVVKRTNPLNITSNVSNGGIASIFELDAAQKEMAIAAVHAVGADYVGVDLLVCGGKSVIGEVNIGPFTVFSKYTRAPVGKILAEYAMLKCDQF